MISRSELASREVWESLANRGDSLNDAYWHIEALPDEEIDEEHLPRNLAVYEEESSEWRLRESGFLGQLCPGPNG